MSHRVIEVSHLYKQYRLGKVGRGTLHEDINRWLHRMMGKADPYLKIDAKQDVNSPDDNFFVWALNDINFSVQQGEVLGIIGRNGAGKSTLLKILSKVTAPTMGEVRIKGRIASLLEVGTGFHPELSGRDNIFLNGAILGMTRKEIQSKFDEIVDFSGVERYIDTPVKRYSSGMYVRLAFAVAAHLEPDILIVDEVLAVGDAEFQKKCLGKMKDVSSQDGRTVLYVSHNMPSVLNLCSKVLALHNGAISFYGNSEESVDYYLNTLSVDRSINNLHLKVRNGNGMIVCNRIDLINEKSKYVESLKSGDTLIVRVYFEVKNKPIRNVLFRLQFVDKDEQIIFICNNEHSLGLFPLLEESGFVSCVIPKLPLFGGDYFINVQVYSKDEGLLDEIECARFFSVVDGDFFGTGKIPVIRKGILVTHTWQYK